MSRVGGAKGEGEADSQLSRGPNLVLDLEPWDHVLS